MGNCMGFPHKSKTLPLLPVENRVSLKDKEKSMERKQSNERKIVIALNSYEGRDEGDLSFEKGDKLYIIDDKEPDWWLAQRFETNEKGYIPMNFVAFNIIETEEWFFGKVSRREAERLLLFDEYPKGTFLVRNSETERPGAYTLSIRDFDALKSDHVKHYRIRQRNDGKLYTSPRRSFAQLNDLVNQYSQLSNGLCCQLYKPCPKTAPHYRPRCGDEIDRNDLQLHRELGSGNFGKVYYGLFKGKIEIAIKTMKPGSIYPSAFVQKAAILRHYRHNNLVSLYGICSIGQPLLIVTEFMANGALWDYLRDNPEGQGCSVLELIDMAAQIASGMTYLENMNFVHRDLAARNILLGENKIVKVADFGLARILQEQCIYEATVGAKFQPKWTAPEAANFGNFTTKSDVWSFGILLYELITKGGNPYPGMIQRDVIEQVGMGYRMPKPSYCECPTNIYELMLQCWDKDPDKRPTFQHLYYNIKQLKFLYRYLLKNEQETN